MDFHKDYYKILGVERTATREHIKSAYRKLVMKYHPDRNPGDNAAEEKMKEINEAYEVLDSDISRFVYDEYRKKEERNREEAKQKESNQNQQQANRRTYQKKTIVRTERKVYVKGNIAVRYWAEQQNEMSFFIMKEVDYTISPVSAEAIITNSDIHEFTAPNQFQKAYKEAEIFKTPLPNPVKCKIITTEDAEEYYDLRLQDVRIIDPVLTDIVKHEKQSLGTLKGEFYGYVLRIDEEEVMTNVTECFGETGRKEQKNESGSEFFRKEYYHKDCTTYWGPWIEIAKPKAATKAAATTSVRTNDYAGCLQYWWIPFLLLFLFIWPQFFLGLLAIAVISWLFSLVASVTARIIPFLGLLLVGFFIYSAFNSGARARTVVKRNTTPSYDSLRGSRDPIAIDTTAATTKSSMPDTLISHFIRWKDYDSISYAITLSVTATDVKKSGVERNNFEPVGFYSSLSPVYNYLENSDQPRLQRIYAAFDSIKNANSLNSTGFAKMVVSCIQSIPYYLVVDQSCDADYHDDEFIYDYLRQCDRECCIGNMKYGVRSPVEFASDLKGDCDTRALIIYSILKRFNYDVALLTSQYYKHAVIAVNFGEQPIGGLAMNIGNKNYYLWETTSAGFQPGQVPEENRNLSYWDIALLNEKK